MPPSDFQQPQSNQPQDQAAAVNPSGNVVQPEPVPPATPAMTSADYPAVASKRSKKPLFIALAVLLVLVSGGVAGALWWTGPQKTFDDAFNPSISMPKGGTAKGSIVVTSSTGPGVTVEFDTKVRGLATNTSLAFKVDAGAMKVDISGGVATDTNKNLYFKINDVRKTVNAFAGGNSDMIDQYYGSLIDKIDGKWVQMTEADLKEATKDSGTDMSCVLDKIAKIEADKSYAEDTAQIYSQNKYFSIKETLASEKIDGQDSHHYKVAIDKAKEESFNKVMRNSKLMKEIKKCVTDPSSLDEESSRVETSSDPTIEVWVNKWTHRLNKLVVSDDQSGLSAKLTVNIGYDDNQPVDVPKASTQYKDLQKEIESVKQQFQDQSGTEEFDTTVLGTSIMRGL